MLPRFALVFLVSLGIALAAGPGMPWAAGDSDSEPETPTAYDVGRKLVEAKNYRGAIAQFQKVVAAEPRNASAWNYLGYSHRKLGEFGKSLGFYQKALAIDPDHRGANEYLGELYLKMGKLDEAKKRLARLDDICTFGCEEFDDLKKAIAAYAGGKSS